MRQKSIVPLWVGAAALAVGAIIPPTLPDYAAAAQEHGDEKCTVSGRLLRYFKAPVPGMSGWMDAFEQCDPRDSRSSDDDSDSRANGNRNSERPEEGDEKCGPDGYVLKYGRDSFTKRGTWERQYRRCSR